MNFPTPRAQQRLSRQRHSQPRFSIGFLPQVEQLEERRLLTVVNWNGLGDGTSWGDQNNWVGTQVPGAAEDAVINVVGTPTIVFSTGGTSVKSLTSAENFTISGGSFTVTGNSSVNGTFTMTGGALNASAAGISFTATSTTNVSNASLNAAAGALVNLPNLTTYSNSAGTMILQSTGTGSVLSLPGLTSLSTTLNNYVQVKALAGGHTTFAVLTQITTSPVQLITDGTGSQLDLSALTTLSGTPGNNNGAISLSNAGTFLHGAITAIDRADISLDGAATTVSFPTLTSLTNLGLNASGGGTLNLAAVASYSNSTGTRVLQSTGAGSVLTLPSLTSLTTTGNNFVHVNALAGGHTTFAALTQITTSPVQLITDGTGSQLDLSALTTLSGTPGNNNGAISLSNAGTFLHGAITAIDRADISLDGAATTVSFPTLTSLTNLGLNASGGGTLNLAAVASYSNSTGTRVLQSTGAGSVLTLPLLTSLTTTGNNFIQVRALAGGHTTFAALTQIITSPTQLITDGTGSQLDLSALTTLHGTVANNNGLVSLSNGGTFLHGAITTIDRVDITLDGAATSVSFPTLTSMTNSHLTASGGGTLNLSALASYSDNALTTVLQSTGSGSVLTLPALTSLSTTGNNFIQVKALAGGHTTFAALTQITTGPIQLITNGAGSQLDLSALTTLHGTVGNNNGIVNLSAGGTFLHGAITTIDRVDIALDGAATSVSFPVLASMSNSNLTASGGGTLNLPALTSYSDNALTTVLQSTGVGSVLTLPALTSLSTTGNNFIQVKALAGGHTTFATLTQLTTSPIQLFTDGTGSQLILSALTTVQGTPGNNNGLIALSAGGAFVHGVITTIDRYDLSLDGAATTVSFPALTSLTNVGLTASGGGTLSLPTVTSYSDSNGTRVLQSTGTGSVLSLPTLTSLSTTGNNFIQVKALSGGHSDLTALALLTTSPVQLISDGANSQLDLSALTTMLITPGNNPSSIQTTNGGVLLDGNNLNTLISDTSVTTSAGGSFTIQSNQTFTADKATPVVAVGTLINQGQIALPDFRTVDVNGGLTLNGQGLITSAVAGTITISGSLLGNTQNSSQFNAQGWVTLDGTGTVGTPQQFEAMSADLGAVQSGFNNNFAYGTLSLANSTYVKLVDLADNAAGAGAEAVYVKKLVVPAGSTLDLNGLHVYVRTSQIAGNVINGTLTPVITPAVVNRQLFYKGSTKYDVGGPPIQPFPDDNAIPAEKKALLPGAGAATYANVSSYTRGINGVIVDIAGNHGTLVPGDFVFKVGNNNTPSTWATAPAPTTISLRPGAGTGSDRYEIMWADNAIQKTWLEVIIRGNDAAGGNDTNTGLASTDFFFFGSAPADSSDGDGPTAFVTNAIDEIRARNHPAALVANIPISNLYDFNRDGKVDSSDQIAARNNANAVPTALKVISFTNPPAAPELEPSAARMTSPPDATIAVSLAEATAVTPTGSPTPTRVGSTSVDPLRPNESARQSAHSALFQELAFDQPTSHRPRAIRGGQLTQWIDESLLELLATHSQRL